MPIEWSGGLIICPMHRRVEYTLDSDTVDIIPLYSCILNPFNYILHDHEI